MLCEVFFHALIEISREKQADIVICFAVTALAETH